MPCGTRSAPRGSRPVPASPRRGRWPRISASRGAPSPSATPRSSKRDGSRLGRVPAPVSPRAHRRAGNRREHHPVPCDQRSSQGLEPGAATYAEFPRTAWLAAARRALATAPHSTYGYGDPLGRIELRTALAGVPRPHARGPRRPHPDRDHLGVPPRPGAARRALRARGADTVAVEAYGLDIYRAACCTTTASTSRPLEVDEERCSGGPAERHAPGAAAVLLTPAHQFPTGYALSAERRAGVIDWARRTGGVILEDDYDGEFRYDRKPVGALQGLDPEHVAYFGTASKSVAPALRLAWVVVPARLLPAVAAGQGPRRHGQRAGSADLRRVHRVGRLRPARPRPAAHVPAPP